MHAVVDAHRTVAAQLQASADSVSSAESSDSSSSSFQPHLSLVRGDVSHDNVGARTALTAGSSSSSSVGNWKGKSFAAARLAVVETTVRSPSLERCYVDDWPTLAVFALSHHG